MIKAIACVGKNNELGKNNGLIFNIKADMVHFKQTTTGKCVICGYNTLLSFPGSKPLQNRETFLICPEEVTRDDCVCFHNFNQMVYTAQLKAKTEDIYVIGGAMLYKSMLPYCQELILTEVESEDKEATVFFPDFYNEFKLVELGKLQEENGLKFRINTYRRSKI